MQKKSTVKSFKTINYLDVFKCVVRNTHNIKIQWTPDNKPIRLIKYSVQRRAYYAVTIEIQNMKSIHRLV